MRLGCRWLYRLPIERNRPSDVQPEKCQPPQKKIPSCQNFQELCQSGRKKTLKSLPKAERRWWRLVKESPRLFKAAAGDQKAENRLGCIKQTMRRQNALGRNTSKKRLKNIQVLAAASLHRQPGMKAILESLTLYRKDCSAGIINLSRKDAFQVAKLHWLSWNAGKIHCICCSWCRFSHLFHRKFLKIT